MSEASVRLAYQYGPFFFALLYAFVILPRSYKWLKENNKANPWLYGSFFTTTWIVEIVLVFFSVQWWGQHQPIYARRGVIHEFKAAELWSPDPLWFQKQFDPSQPGEDTTFDLGYIAYQEREPFAKSRFEIRYRKPHDPTLPAPPLSRLYVDLDDNDPEYEFQYDEATQSNRLVHSKPSQNGSKVTFDWSVGESLFAQSSIPPRRPQQQAVQTPAIGAIPLQSVVTALQSERLYTGSEIQAVDTLRGLSREDRRAFVEREGTTEPMIITLFDLTRHEDRELRSKARALVHDLDIKVEDLFRRKLGDHDPQVRMRYLSALTRLDVHTASEATEHATAKDLRSVREKTAAAGFVPRLLQGSSSTSGDRYWIGGQWRSGDVPMQNCVARVLKPIGEPKPAGSVLRTWSYSKARVLAAADAVDGCYAVPRFEHP